MDPYLSNNQNRHSSFEVPPVLIVADNETAKARARQTVTLAGLRVADAVEFGPAPDRLRQQAAASALWLELDGDDLWPAAAAVLDAMAADISDGRYAAVVAAPSAVLDRLGGHALDAHFTIIVDADDAERAAALAVATSGIARPSRVADITADRNAARLRQLSDEVSRIATTLARLSTGPAATRPIDIDDAGSVPDVSMDMLRAIIRARRLRSRYFDEELFADPAWDMLLDLLQAELSKLRVPVSSLCIAAAVPATTALRWLKTMVQQGLFVRRADPHDGRRVFVELAPHTSQALRRYFAEVGGIGVV